MTLVVVNLAHDNKRWRKIGAIKINNIIPIVGKIRGGVRLWFIQSHYGIINLAKIPLCYFGNVCFRNLMYIDLKYSIEELIYISIVGHTVANISIHRICLFFISPFICGKCITWSNFPFWNVSSQTYFKNDVDVTFRNTSHGHYIPITTIRENSLIQNHSKYYWI